jgi:hypothetical protein
MVHVANHASIDAAFVNSVARYTPDTEVQPEVRSHRLPLDGTARPLSVRDKSLAATSGKYATSTSLAARWLTFDTAGFNAKVAGVNVVGVPGVGSIATKAA